MSGAKRLRRTRPEPTEADVLASVLQYLALLERTGRLAWYARMNAGAGRLQRGNEASQWMRFGFPGQPDIMAQTTDGRFVALEVKRPTGRVRPEQDEFLAKVERHGGIAAVVRSVDDVDRALG